eukprot:m.535201 g.535201  ORF g.535201 m.535201 type:complete len:230 (+) comp22064_c0_seq1:384-1073(+)
MEQEQLLLETMEENGQVSRPCARTQHNNRAALIGISANKESLEIAFVKNPSRIIETIDMKMVLRVVGERGANSFSVDAVVSNKKRREFQWRYKHASYSVRAGEDESVATNIFDVLSEAVRKNKSARPRKLRVFVNPISGKKKGPGVYATAKRLFDICDIQVDVLTTEYSGHAKKVAEEEDLAANADGVVIVGGDGFFNEVRHERAQTFHIFRIMHSLLRIENDFSNKLA